MTEEVIMYVGRMLNVIMYIWLLTEECYYNIKGDDFDWIMLKGMIIDWRLLIGISNYCLTEECLKSD